MIKLANFSNLSRNPACAKRVACHSGQHLFLATPEKECPDADRGCSLVYIANPYELLQETVPVNGKPSEVRIR
ncbi:MAG TPA: hypothetical protein PLJ71_18995, partial [Candidatus Hydrogenedentes bacterium]|nr:hypothetical protein [Candidatus Hydrogenedentota bacterium]